LKIGNFINPKAYKGKEERLSGIEFYLPKKLINNNKKINNLLICLTKKHLLLFASFALIKSF